MSETRDLPESPLSESEVRWLEEFGASLRGHWNMLPMRIPPRIRERLDGVMAVDDRVRELDHGALPSWPKLLLAIESSTLEVRLTRWQRFTRWLLARVYGEWKAAPSETSDGRYSGKR